MTRCLARLGDKTTSGGYIATAKATIIEERKIALLGDTAYCPQDTCKGFFEINGTAHHFLENSPCVATGDQVLCNCKMNQVLGSTTLWVQQAPENPFEEHRKRAAEWPITKAIAAEAALSSLPVYAKSCLHGEGCTDEGTDQESVENFGHAGYYRATPQAEQPEEEPVQHAQAAKKHKPAEPPPPEDNRPWYKRLFSSPDTTKVAATAGMATARAATTTGITAGATTEAGYAALQKIGGNLSTAGRWIAPNPTTVFLFGMFYSPKLNSGEQDYIDKMRLGPK